MKLNSCFFIGHHNAPESIYEVLERTVERCAADYGVTSFTVGHYGNFDAMAARAVRKVKAHRPELKLTLLLPYYSAEIRQALPRGFDNSFYPPGMETVPKRLAIPRANCWMMENSSILIAYVSHPGNAKKLFEQAEKRKEKGLLVVENLFSKN